MSDWAEYIKERFYGQRDRWFMWIPVLFGTGTGLYFLLPEEPSRWLTLLVIEMLLAAVYINRFHPERLLCLATLAIIAAGFANIQLRTIYLNKNEIIPYDRKLYLTGRVADLGTNYRGNPRFVLEDMSDFDDQKIPGRYRVSLTSKNNSLKNGDCIELVATVMPPMKANLPGGFEQDRRVYYEGINATGYAASRALPAECKTEAPLMAKAGEKISVLRQSIVKRIEKILPRDEAGIVAAIVAGERGLISRKITENYRDSGLAHFLSISGLHMSMIAGLMFFLVRLTMALIPPLALRYDSKKAAAVFAILMSFVYLLISGAEIPSQRAFIMTFIVLLGVLFDRQAISIRMISWAALIVLVISPEAIISPSFQMSFAAVVVLIAFYERFAGTLHRFLNGSGQRQPSLPLKIIKIIFAYVAGILISDLVASLATLPYSVYHFNRIAVYTTLGNLLAGPVIGLVIMPFVLLSLLLMPLHLDVWSLKIVGYGIGIVNDITAFTAGLPGAGYQVLSLPLWGLVLITLGGLWLCIWTGRWRLWGWLGILVGILSLLTVRVPDVMADKYGEVFAVKDNRGELVILPSRGNSFVKKIWLEKAADKKLDAKEQRKLKRIYDGRETDKEWLDLACDERYCVYKGVLFINKFGGIEIDGKDFDLYGAEGAVFFVRNNKVEVRTVRDYIGRRPWNSF